MLPIYISVDDVLTRPTKQQILAANLAHKANCKKPTVKEQAHIPISKAAQ